MQNKTILFRFLAKINPIVAICGTVCLGVASHYHIDWLSKSGFTLLMLYNFGNLYVYYVQRRLMFNYILSTSCHILVGLWVVFG